MVLNLAVVAVKWTRPRHTAFARAIVCSCQNLGPILVAYLLTATGSLYTIITKCKASGSRSSLLGTYDNIYLDRAVLRTLRPFTL